MNDTAMQPNPRRFDLYCESPAIRLDYARDEGRTDWPKRVLPENVTPQHVTDTLHSLLRAHPGIDHIVFTDNTHPGRPYLQAHLVDHRIHVLVQTPHRLDARSRAIVDHLHTAITDAFPPHPTIDITPDLAGLHQWAREALTRHPCDSTADTMARTVLNLLHLVHSTNTSTGLTEATHPLSPENPMPHTESDTTLTQDALGLFAALLTFEARFADDPQARLDELDAMTPADALDTILTVGDTPTELLTPIRAALHHLDPTTYPA
ncbi:hypothetical protein ACWDUL_21080 [Nocardia niigatensis]